MNHKIKTRLITAAILLLTSFSIAAAEIERVSVDSLGNQSLGPSTFFADDGNHYPSISADGRFVAFQSKATNLVTGDTNRKTDIFVHDRDTNITTRISFNTSGFQANGNSYFPSISANGRFVAFSSIATNLVSGDTNGEIDIFVHDRNTNITSRVNTNSSGVQGDRRSNSPSISADGRFVTFNSRASNLVTGDTNGAWDIFVHDRNTSITTRVSINSNGVQGNRNSLTSAISANGRFVVFHSYASNLVTGDTNSGSDIFVHDRNTSTTQRVSIDSSGVQGNNGFRAMDPPTYPAISADGRFVAFSSFATNLVTGDTAGREDIFIHDRDTSITTKVSISSNGIQANSSSQNPTLSADGRFVTFGSGASNLVPRGTPRDGTNIFVHDRHTSTTTRVRIDSYGVQGDGPSHKPAISADGHFVAFSSYATNLIVDDTNGNSDIFVTSIITPPKQDFNADGKADIFWRNVSNGMNYMTFMDGATIRSSAQTYTITDNNWQLQGTGDFNADGYTDALWRNTVTGRNHLLMMNSSTIIAHGDINTISSFSWVVAGIKDFDGDGRADILWRNTATGQNYLYHMDGTTIKSHARISSVHINWQIQSVDDFNGDGKTDILWRHTSTGQNYIYIMNDSAIIDSGLIYTVADLSWEIAGTGDFDGDRKADILWRNSSTGQNFLSLMDGLTFRSHASINTVRDLNWQIKGVGDFNGDGKADILWRHATTGHNYLYMMNGSAISAHGSIDTVPDLNWEIQ